MTAVLAISVREGVVLTTDSRTTIQLGDEPKQFQTFDNVQKVFRLHPELPIAVMTWGLNQLGDATIAELIKEAGDRLAGQSPKHKDWELDSEDADLEPVAERVTNFLFHDHYQPISEKLPDVANCTLHFAGFSSGKRRPEQAEAVLMKDHIQGPRHLVNNAVQVNYTGTYTARIMGAMDPRVLPVFEKAGFEAEKAQRATRKITSESLRRLLHPSMPLIEVARLSRNLMNTEIALTQFGPEPDVVGGGIQMAVISRDKCRLKQYPVEHFAIRPEGPN
ncbi:MAG TPA: hypothetical protein DDW52_23690 [Planctomycetaceae bacterium]|nr:hypothetical protein [Planctomycetaceae bacterium]